MESSSFNNDQLIIDELGSKILDSYTWWAKKRLLFNILVGLTGLLTIFTFGFNFYIADMLGILAWGLVANGLYSFGYVVESLVLVRTKGASRISQSRSLLFWLGTVAYMLVTLASGYFYFFALMHLD